VTRACRAMQVAGSVGRDARRSKAALRSCAPPPIAGTVAARSVLHRLAEEEHDRHRWVPGGRDGPLAAGPTSARTLQALAALGRRRLLGQRRGRGRPRDIPAARRDSTMDAHFAIPVCSPGRRFREHAQTSPVGEPVVDHLELRPAIRASQISSPTPRRRTALRARRGARAAAQAGLRCRRRACRRRPLRSDDRAGREADRRRDRADESSTCVSTAAMGGSGV
jgi:hypothetical protein